VAFDRRDVMTERPISDVPIEGIELPEDAFVMPLGHRATLRVALAHSDDHARARPGGLLGRLPTAPQVARGWLTLTERASRFVLPDGERGAGSAETVTARRCELALGSVAHADDDAAGFAFGLGELVRMGEDPTDWIPELVEAVERIGPIGGWEADVALASAGRVLAAAGEDRAGRDLARIVARRDRSSRPDSPPGDITDIAWLEGWFADGPALMPHGLPDEWLGQPIEVYGIPTGDASTVSYALRWHGARPAVLWEQSGPRVALTSPIIAPDWTTSDTKGEALWPDPAA
jgi:hypothetical protein